MQARCGSWQIPCSAIALRSPRRLAGPGWLAVAAALSGDEATAAQMLAKLQATARANWAGPVLFMTVTDKFSQPSLTLRASALIDAMVALHP